METKSDFAQKLLYDLRLRKERLASAQKSGTYCSNRKILQGTKDTKTLDIIGTKNGSTYKGSIRSQKSDATRRSTNQLVAYDRSRHSGQGDISMALAYAFDREGKLKRVDFAGNGAIMAFLQQQIGRKPTQQNPNTLWQTTNQFPTLTHLHIDEIAKGAQKLNQILKACSNGLKFDQASIEIGNELWKGAMELEQSLRMLVSLQEASEGMMSPQRKSSVKLLENEDSEDKRTSQEKGKQVERPVFSFDKHSKNSKATGQTGQQKNVLALTYLQESPDIKSEKQADMTSKRSSHRRTASCSPEFLASQQTTSSKSMHNRGRTPNVIAKLMGLEELSQRTNTNVTSNSRTDTVTRSSDVDPTRILQSSRSSEFKTVNANDHPEQNAFLSNKMSIRKSLEVEFQMDKHKSPFDNRPTTGDPLNQRWSGELREMGTNHNRSTEAIFKINQLQGQITQLHQKNGSEGPMRSNLRLSTIGQTQEKVTEWAEPKQRQLMVKSTNSKSTNKTTTEPLNNRETQAASKRLLHQQKQRKVLSVNEPHGKKPKSEEIKQEMSTTKRDSRHMEGSKLKTSQNTASTKNLQKQQPTKQAKAKEHNTAEPGGERINSSEALLNSGHYKDLTKCNNITSSEEYNSSSNPEQQQKSTSSNQEFQSSVTQDDVPLKSDAKQVGVPRQSMQGLTNPNFPRMANEVMTRTAKTTTKTIKQLKRQRPIVCGIEQKHGKNNHRKDTSQSNDSVLMTADTRRENPDLPKSEKSKQQVDTQQMATKDDITNEAQEEIVVQVLNEENFIRAAVVHEQEQQTGADVHIADSEKTTTAPSDGYTDNTDEAYNIKEQKRPVDIEKQQPLTDEERSLKQRLMTNHLFLNTAEALFKLNIPLNILNYASDHICQEKEDKLTVECAYELLKQKGRRREMLLYPVTNKFISHGKIGSFDDLVRVIHQDFMTLRSYGKNGRQVYDDAEYLLTMLERDIYYTDPDVNCMWDLGWRKFKLSYVEIDEVISDVQSKVIEELLDEILKDCMYISEFQRKEETFGSSF